MRQRRQSTPASPVPADTVTVAFYTASFVYHLLTGRQVHPYVLLGVGGVHDSGHGSSVAVTAGAGAKVFLTPRVSLRVEGRPFLSWDTSFVRYSGGIGYHW
jgi:opacity protein-like surface antigen